MVNSNRAIFFDRDGVLIETKIFNKKPYAIKFLKEVKLCKSIKDICNFYYKSFYLIMVTNQPDFEKKKNTKKNIQEINLYLKKKLKLHDVYVNYSANDKDINRKPNPGMLLKAKKKYNLNLKDSYMIGDRWRDIGAGNKVNCKTIFFDRQYKEKLKYKPNFKITKLSQVFDIIDIKK